MSQRFLFPCPNCQVAFELVPKQAGQDLECASCGQACLAPKLGQIRQLETVGGDGTKAQAGSPEASRPANGLKNLLFAGGLAIAILGGGAGYGLFRYAESKIEDFDVENEVADFEAFADSLSPAQVVQYFESLKVEEGLGEWREQTIIGENRQGMILRNIAFGIMGLGGAGLLSMLASLGIKR